jgi:hypothetical protein
VIGKVAGGVIGSHFGGLGTYLGLREGDVLQPAIDKGASWLADKTSSIAPTVSRTASGQFTKLVPRAVGALEGTPGTVISALLMQQGDTLPGNTPGKQAVRQAQAEQDYADLLRQQRGAPARTDIELPPDPPPFRTAVLARMAQ